MNYIHVRAEAQWQKAVPHVNVQGVWLPCKATYVNVGGTWHKVYQRSAVILPFPTRRLEGELQDVCISAA